jgi:peptidoglycan L-alanyl-D-glutamate endopeptidase CwlK
MALPHLRLDAVPRHICHLGRAQPVGRCSPLRVSDVLVNSKGPLANEPAVAGIVLAQFLGNKEQAIRGPLAAHNLKLARKLVNGGTHGLDRFIDAFERGERVLPS